MKTKDMILNFIKKYMLEHCYPPAFEEIMEDIGIKSKSTISRYINQMLESGELENDFNDGAHRYRCYRPKGIKCIEVVEND